LWQGREQHIKQTQLTRKEGRKEEKRKQGRKQVSKGRKEGRKKWIIERKDEKNIKERNNLKSQRYYCTP
jgi:hypothetical protein